PEQSCDHVQHRRFASTRRADDRRQPVAEAGLEIEPERTECVLNPQIDAHAWSRFNTRARYSDASSATTEIATEKRASRIAIVSPPGRSRAVKIPSASVCVWPGMLETNVIVAPNSPSALAKPIINPARIPGSARGRVTVRNTQSGRAPSV